MKRDFPKMDALKLEMVPAEALPDGTREWLRFLSRVEAEGKTENYIRRVQSEFIKAERASGRVFDMRKVLDVARYVRYMAERVTPDGRMLAVSRAEIDRRFGPQDWGTDGF